MHVLVHLIIALAFGLAFGFRDSVLLVFILGSTLIDFDHPIYLIISKKMTSMREMKKWMDTEQEKHNPHFYFMHTLEFTIFLALLAPLSEIFLAYFLGHLLHMALDIATYIYVYRSYKPWAKFMIATYYFRNSL